MATHPHPTLEEHGVVGDLRTVALVSTAGTVDFLCWPRFDAPTVFAALLDPERGGQFALAPDLGDGVRCKQLYLPDTNVLLTRFLSADAVAEVTDLMPVERAGGGGAQRLVRVASCVRGEGRGAMRRAPRFDYARAAHRGEAGRDERSDAAAVWFTAERADGPAGGGPAGPERLRLLATTPLHVDGGDAVATFTLRQGESATFVLDAPTSAPGDGGGDHALPCGLQGYGAQCFGETVAFWRAWIDRSSYRGRYREIVRRSALALKLLTSAEHGSIVAAPTFGLPEALGGERNWDYRYTWIRDAAFTVYAFLRLGLTSEADAFMRWAYARTTERPHGDGPLQIMYGLDGRATLDEAELPHLAGYADSRPVRVGNAAFDQLQLDSYGALMDAVYLANKYGTPVSYDGWRAVARTVDWVCENWRREDEGIWEFRGGRREFLSSRLMCWVAVDRALRMAQKFSLPGPYARWLDARNAIHASVYDDFWDAGQRAFVQAKGSAALDASCLLMPLVKFVSPTDPRWLSTLDAVGRELASDALVRRYAPEASADAARVDGLPGTEGSFTVCSFWYVECLARAGRVDEARLLFDKLLSYANHVGLYAEELGPAGDHLGNFPQALTHLALISAAYALDRALDDGPAGGRRAAR